MSHFQRHTADTAPAAARPVLSTVQKQLGFVPNLYGALSESPAALQAYTAIADALENHGGLGPIERNLAAIAISVENRCDYCVAAHSTVVARRLDSAALEAVREGRPLEDPRLEAVRSLSVDLVRQRGFVDADRLQQFYDAGFEPQHVLDLVAVAALKTLSNFATHITEPALDTAFQPQAWQPAA